MYQFEVNKGTKEVFGNFFFKATKLENSNAFYRWFRAEVTARKDLLLAFVTFYRWFSACGVNVGANLLLHFLGSDILRTPVTVEADILSSLIESYNWFFKRATAEADFLGSSIRVYFILDFVRDVSCWRSTEIFLYFNIDFRSNWLLEQMFWVSVVFLSLILFASDCTGRYVAFFLWISLLIMCTSDCGSGCFKVLCCILCWL